MPSPLRIAHGTKHGRLGMLFGLYSARTPGVETGDNATVMLGDESEPQPDLYLRILPGHGGQSRTSDDGYVEGAPELVAEVALSSRAIDLHAKRDDYRKNGVIEYLVYCVKPPALRWFDLRTNQELSPDSDGVYRLRTFPGLWINGRALISDDATQLLTTLDAGIASAEHAAFVQRLAAAKR